MTKLTKTVFFIPPQDAPTEPGWYYGRRNTHVKDAPISPISVLAIGKPDGFGRTSFNLGGKSFEILSEFDWFGPVPECVEARLPS